ncbi:MAG: LysR substrate-binding domain-containing protein [Pseudomonadota bacterium]
MTLTQLRYLVAIVDANLNITLAAERVHATQPGISKQLKLLEQELALQIFQRRGKSLVQISPEGAQIIERARVILSEAANIRTVAANYRKDSEGELVIATTQTQALFLLPASLKTLKARYPGVNVRLNLFSDPDRAKSAAADADLLIASGAEPVQANAIAIPLYHWNRVALVQPDHPLAALGRPLQLDDLARYPLIGYESALGSHASVAEAFAAAGRPAEFAYAAHDTQVIKTFVQSGLGVGLLAEMASVDEPDLVRLPIEGLPTGTAYAVLKRDRVLRNYVLDFVAGLAPHLERPEIVKLITAGRAFPAPPSWSERTRLSERRLGLAAAA